MWQVMNTLHPTEKKTLARVFRGAFCNKVLDGLTIFSVHAQKPIAENTLRLNLNTANCYKKNHRPTIFLK
jgi:hypothetical protein